MARTKKSATERWGDVGPRGMPPPEDVPNDQPLSDAAAGFAKEQLKSFIERIERLEEEKKTIADDIKDVFAEAKGNGFDTKALRAILRIRKQDADQLAEHQAIVDLYLEALGMLADTPLGQAARYREGL
ncbi:MAG: hypothetical protein K0R27_282 [Xanthobacteraceae bacterium]|jgi:uncharacterized protein (UPF0335 family)|nr:hypothetical protein [Xanthobacteraceae bacterium]